MNGMVVKADELKTVGEIILGAFVSVWREWEFIRNGCWTLARECETADKATNELYDNTTNTPFPFQRFIMPSELPEPEWKMT